jgi:hypothetical protein
MPLLPPPRPSRRLLAALLLGLSAAPHAPALARAPPAAEAPLDPDDAVERLRREARALEPLVQSPWVRRFLRATRALPHIPTRTFFVERGGRGVYPADRATRLPAATRILLEERMLDEAAYYTRFSTPLAYARPLELLARAGFSPEGKRVLDFGYGNVGQLKLLALLGADVRGIEVDPVLPHLYAAEQGRVRGLHGRDGSLRLFDGAFPADPALRRAVGGGYDLFLSKNTLKRGYVHPEQPVPPRQRVDLGVSDAEFLATLHGLLRPGGRVLLYNLSTASTAPGEPYRPSADGRSPFSREQWEAAGFRVLALDADDRAEARRMAHALGWDAGPAAEVRLEDLGALYTLVERPADAQP